MNPLESFLHFIKPPPSHTQPIVPARATPAAPPADYYDKDGPLPFVGVGKPSAWDRPRENFNVLKPCDDPECGNCHPAFNECVFPAKGCYRCLRSDLEAPVSVRDSFGYRCTQNSRGECLPWP